MIAIIFVLSALSSGYAEYTYTPLKYPGAIQTWADGINNARTLVGAFEQKDSNNSTYGFY